MSSKNMKRIKFTVAILFILFLAIPVFCFSIFKVYEKQLMLEKSNRQMQIINDELNSQVASSAAVISEIRMEIEKLNNEDLRKNNTQVRKEMTDLKESFRAAVSAYEQVLYLQDKGVKVSSHLSKFSSILYFLSKNDLASAIKASKELATEIDKEKAKLMASSTAPIPANVPEITEAPASGYRRQKVSVGGTSFLVDIVSADLNSTKVIVDTASDGTCTNDCPVLPLATYVSRSGAYAGVNGTYFCPDTYPSCADKKNTFDVLVMNKNKVYFNSDNNVYSTVPVAIFSGSSARFIGLSSGWGRDTGVDSVIANRPLLVLDGNLMFGGAGEEKEATKGNRSFLGASGSTGYIGVVHSASVAESAKVIQAMGIKSAINLDNGGSTALWSGGYKVGPGRNLPNVVLFVKK